jgi:hypothetical protein
VPQVPGSRGHWTVQVVGGRHWARRGLIHRRRERRKHRRDPGRRRRRAEQNYGEKSCESGKKVGAN